MSQEQEKINVAPPVEATPATAEKTVRKTNKKAVKQVPRGSVYIQASYNNTIVTITDPNGNALAWGSAGMAGFKGPKKATPYAAGLVVKNVVDKCAQYGLKDVVAYIKGIGGGREGAIRALHANGLNVTCINEVTPIPHNGCRAPKRRRV